MLLTPGQHSEKTLAARRTGQDLRRRRAASPSNGVLEAYWRPVTTHELLNGPVADDAVEVDRAVVSYSTLILRARIIWLDGTRMTCVCNETYTLEP